MNSLTNRKILFFGLTSLFVASVALVANAELVTKHLEKKECTFTDEKCSGVLDVNEVAFVSVKDIPKGSFELQVFSSNPHSLFSCTFYDGSGNAGRKQEFAPTCNGVFSLSHKDFVKVRVENVGDGPVDYRVQVIKD